MNSIMITWMSFLINYLLNCEIHPPTNELLDKVVLGLTARLQVRGQAITNINKNLIKKYINKQ